MRFAAGLQPQMPVISNIEDLPLQDESAPVIAAGEDGEEAACGISDDIQGAVNGDVEDGAEQGNSSCQDGAAADPPAEEEAPTDAAAPKPALRQADLLNDLGEKWIFYLDEIDSSKAPSAQTFEGQLKEVGSFDTLKEFWRNWTALEVESLKEGVNLRMFRAGIKPTWEDPANRAGGKWVARNLAPGSRGRTWPTVALAMVQGLLKGEVNERVCGLVLSTRQGTDSIQVWCGNDFDPKVAGDKATVGSVLQKLVAGKPGDSTAFAYQPHVSNAGAKKKAAGMTATATVGEKSKSALSKKEEVQAWLTSINLEEYYDAFIADGFDDMRSLIALEDAELTELGMKKGHKKRFFAARDKILEAQHPQQQQGGVARPTPAAKFRAEPRVWQDGTSMAGNWRDGPTKAPAREASAPAGPKPKAPPGGPHGEYGGKGGTFKRPETSPAAPSTSTHGGLSRPTTQPTSSGATALQQLQYLAQVHSLQQQANMLGPMLSYGIPTSLSAAGVPAYATPYGGAAGAYSGGDWASLLAAMQAQGAWQTPGPSSSSSDPHDTKSSAFKLNPQAAAFKPSRPMPPSSSSNQR